MSPSPPTAARVTHAIPSDRIAAVTPPVPAIRPIARALRFIPPSFRTRGPGSSIVGGRKDADIGRPTDQGRAWVPIGTAGRGRWPVLLRNVGAARVGLE